MNSITVILMGSVKSSMVIVGSHPNEDRTKIKLLNAIENTQYNTYNKYSYHLIRG